MQNMLLSITLAQKKVMEQNLEPIRQKDLCDLEVWQFILVDDTN